MTMVLDPLAIPAARQRSLVVAVEDWRQALVRFAAALVEAAVEIGETLSEGRRKPPVVAPLSALPAHTLRDIGLERSSLSRAVRELEQGVDPRRSAAD